MKKLLALLLSMAFMFSFSGCTYAASDDDSYKNNVGTIDLDSLTVTGDGIEVDGNTIIISEGGDFTVTGSLDDGMIKVNTDDKVKLRLSGMSLTNSTGPAIYFENVKKGFITITENTENYLADGAEYSIEDADAALFSNDDLEIKGSGTLTVVGNYKHGIASDDDLSIENGTIKITATEHGIKANDKLSVTGGNLDITAKTGKGMKAGEELVIDAGTINIVSLESEGIESKGTLTINGGDINIEAADDGINTGSSSSESTTEGFGGGQKDRTFEKDQNTQNQEMPADRQGRQQNGEGMPNGEPPQMPEGTNPPQMKNGQKMGGKSGSGNIGEQNGNFRNGNMPEPPQRPDGEMATPPQMPDGEMPDMQSGQGGMNPGGFGRIDDETAALHAITINGGNITIKAAGDGIDSNGSLTITGGTIKVYGPENNGNGPLDSEGTMTITGGEIITLSSSGMLQLPNSSDTQNTLKVIFDSQGNAGDTVTVKDSSGKEIMSAVSEGKYAALIYSSENIKEGEKYSIYVNGSLATTVTASSGVTSVGNSMGSGDRLWGKGMKDQGGKGKNISVSVNGKSVSFNTNPVIKNDTTLVGFRSILETLGAEVTWDESTKTVTAKKDGINIVLTINSDKAKVNGKEYTLLTAPEIINDSTMIPVRFVSENLGMDVSWNGDTRHIDITAQS